MFVVLRLLYKKYCNHDASFSLRSVSRCNSSVNNVKYVDDDADNRPANQVLYACFLCFLCSVPFFSGFILHEMNR